MPTSRQMPTATKTGAVQRAEIRLKAVPESLYRTKAMFALSSSRASPGSPTANMEKRRCTECTLWEVPGGITP
jgi:hypothetical protein